MWCLAALGTVIPKVHLTVTRGRVHICLSHNQNAILLYCVHIARARIAEAFYRDLLKKKLLAVRTLACVTCTCLCTSHRQKFYRFMPVALYMPSCSYASINR